LKLQWQKIRRERTRGCVTKSSFRDVSRSSEADESELSLALIVCLLESQARADPALTSVTTKVRDSRPTYKKHDLPI
jgi:hypothetical protein